MLLLGRAPSGVDGTNLVKTKVFSAHPIRTTRPWGKYFSAEGVVSPRRMVALTITLNLVGCPLVGAFLFETGAYSFKVIGDLMAGKYYC